MTVVFARRGSIHPWRPVLPFFELIPLLAVATLTPAAVADDTFNPTDATTAPPLTLL